MPSKLSGNSQMLQHRHCSNLTSSNENQIDSKRDPKQQQNIHLEYLYKATVKGAKYSESIRPDS